MKRDRRVDVPPKDARSLSITPHKDGSVRFAIYDERDQTTRVMLAHVTVPKDDVRMVIGALHRTWATPE